MKGSARPSFGALLREFRLAAGLSQEELAERAAISADGIGALERGVNRAPQRETLARLLSALPLDAEQRHAIEEAAVRPSRPRGASRRTLDRHNLPRPPSPLFGRERELEEIHELLARSPLVTLTGSGGVGKTRLAVEVGFAALLDGSGEVWFVDLAPLRDPRDVVPAIAELLGVRERGGNELLEELVDLLGRRKALLILDNCEHVVAATAVAAEAICNGCNQVVILATSRQPLQAAGEQTYRLASLDAEASVALFADVARRADVSYALVQSDIPVVERICRRLDGIALAIELAAARVKVLALEQIEELLSERFRVLTGTARLPRHQTMRALVDWSYDLLSPEEQLLFCRLAVYSGDFSLEAVLAVCADERIRPATVLDLVGSLVDKSLVTSERRVRAQRFRLLETMRAYALDKLGDDIHRWSRRHAEYYLKLVESVDVTASDGGTSVLEPEYENVRRALEWAIDDGHDVEIGVRLLFGIREFHLLRGFGADAARWAERTIAEGGDLPLRLQAMAWETLAGMRGDLLLPAQAMEAAQRALAALEALDDRAGVARALRGVGIAHLRMGMFAEAEADLARALDLIRQHGTARDLSRTLGSMALALEMSGRLEEGRKITLDVLAMARRDDDERIVWVSLTNLAETEFALGEVESAAHRLEELLASKMARRNVRLRANTRSNLAAYYIALGRVAAARELARAAVLDARQAGDYGIMSCALGHLATILSHGDPKGAARLLGYVESVFASGYRRENTERYTHDLLMDTLHQALTDDQIADLVREGAFMTEDAAVRYVLSNRRIAATE